MLYGKSSCKFWVACCFIPPVKSNSICLQGIMDNGPARKRKVAIEMQRAGDKVSDMAEVGLLLIGEKEFMIES